MRASDGRGLSAGREFRDPMRPPVSDGGLRCPRCDSPLKNRMVFYECPGCGYKLTQPPAPSPPPVPAGRAPKFAYRWRDALQNRMPGTPDRLARFGMVELPHQLHGERAALCIIMAVELILLFMHYSLIRTDVSGAVATSYLLWLIVVPALLNFANLYSTYITFKMVGIAWGIVSALFALALLLEAAGISGPGVVTGTYCQITDSHCWVVIELLIYQFVIGIWFALFYYREAQLLTPS